MPTHSKHQNDCGASVGIDKSPLGTLLEDYMRISRTYEQNIYCIFGRC